eukprot:1774547-Pyramimonas_sp.AAC.1
MVVGENDGDGRWWLIMFGDDGHDGDDYDDDYEGDVAADDDFGDVDGYGDAGDDCRCPLMMVDGG